MRFSPKAQSAYNYWIISREIVAACQALKYQLSKSPVFRTRMLSDHFTGISPCSFTRSEAGSLTCVGCDSPIHGTDGLKSPPKDQAMRIKRLAQGHNCRGRDSNREPPVWKSDVLSARPRQLLSRIVKTPHLYYADLMVNELMYNYHVHTCYIIIQMLTGGGGNITECSYRGV